MAEISILMPIYNAEEYLRESLDSILSQTYTDYEVLMVDDGSTDKSGAICDEYAAKDRRFCVRHQKNGGGGVARNALLSWANESSGKYVVWVDADDLVAPDYLEFLHRKIEENPTYNMVQCGFTSDLEKFKTCNDSGNGASEWSITDPEKLLMEMQSGEHGLSFTVLWNKIYRKHVYRDVKVLMTSEISGKIYNDINILWKIYLNAGNCLISNNILYYYRYVKNSVQHKKVTERKLEFLPLYSVVYSECKKRGYNQYADFLSERMLFNLALNLGQQKTEYEDYRRFYKAAKNLFFKLQQRMTFRCQRTDLKVLSMIGERAFVAFRLYGCLYIKLRALKKRDTK